MMMLIDFLNLLLVSGLIHLQILIYNIMAISFRLIRVDLFIFIHKADKIVLLGDSK